jgi:hypothetical protein
VFDEIFRLDWGLFEAPVLLTIADCNTGDIFLSGILLEMGRVILPGNFPTNRTRHKTHRPISGGVLTVQELCLA